MKTIAALGGNFDCASKGEIASVMAIEGMNPSTDIIFANPCKQIGDMRYARKTGVTMVTFDNEHELIKIKEHWPEVGLVMRIITDDSHSICKFSTKFGVPLDNTTELITKVKQYGLNLIGISFHVGSGCLSVESFEAAVRSAHSVFQEAQRQGFNMRLLDIGGGFPGTNDVTPSFASIANVVRPLLDELFPQDIQIIAEPGRYFAAASHVLACNVYSKRTTEVYNAELNEKTKEFLYYINDGVYGSFNCILFDHAVVSPLVVKEPMIATGEIENTYISTVFGPTCDSMDTINKRIPLPELHVGDWVYYDNFGAYTLAAGSAFNGFKTTQHHYVLRL
jgi:ornithine decarboxylase